MNVDKNQRAQRAKGPSFRLVRWLACAVLLGGCFENVDLTNHPCGACAPCEVCVDDPVNGPHCGTVPHTQKRCSGSGAVYWTDSCGAFEEQALSCSGNTLCTEQGTDAVCACTNHWQGTECTECPSGWDPAANCAACLPHHTGSDCNECLPHWDSTSSCLVCSEHWTGSDCNECPGNWDTEQDCTVCRNLWAGPNCDRCPVNVDPNTDCTECRDNWGGDTCTVCRGNWDLQANCTTCLPGWQDNGDDCGTCTPGLEGAGCEESCGNGVATTNEACDDGNQISWDGCDACTIREQRINTTAAGDDSQPAIAASPSGAMVIVWLRSYAATGMRAIFGQKFSAAGQAEGAEFQVTESAGATIDKPGVDMADDERFTVVWQNGTTIDWRRFDAIGAPVGPEEEISGASVVSSPAIAIDGDGSGAVVWVDAEADSSSIRGISFDPEGVSQAQLSFGSAVVDDGSPFAKTPSVAISSSGAPVVAYVHERRFGGSPFLYCDKVIYTSGPTETYAEPGCASSVDESNPHLSVSQAGLLVLSWVKLSAGTRTVSGRYLNGSSLLDLGGAQAGVAPRVALFSGNVGAAVKVNGQSVLYRRFTTSASEDILVNNLADAASPAADIAALPNSDYAIVWSAAVDPNGGTDIMGVRVGLDGGVLPWIH